MEERTTERRPTLRATLWRQPRLSAAQRTEMWGLFSRFYADVDPATFERDLAGKHDVILLRDRRDQSLQGFSTLMRYQVEAGGRRYAIVFSGDTIVAPEYWGQTALQVAFYRYVVATKIEFPTLPVYWFLITKGYRTYLLLSRNFLEYWPRHDRPTPAPMLALLEKLARDRFGDAFDSERGILVFDSPHGRLKGEVAPVTPELLEHADIRFFADKNPNHARGDELCCLGRIDARFALAYAAKRLGRMLPLFDRRRRKPWRSATTS
jgi:hypothetical protein